MDILIKAAVIGVVGALVTLVMKKSNPEMSVLLILAVGALILGFVLELFSSVREIIDLAVNASNLSHAVLTPVLKCVGIGIITRLAGDVCRDAKAETIASSVELAGAACALYVSMPLLKTLIQMIAALV